MTVVIVEDNLASFTLLKVVLERLGWQCSHFSSGEDLLSSISSGQFDLILTDLTLPGVSGLELTRQLRKKGVPTPIVVLSAHSSSEMGKKALEAGANAYYTKPFDLQELRSLMEAITKKIQNKSPL